MKNTISNWIANAVYVNRGTKFGFVGRKWAHAMFDTYSPNGRLWKMSRQVGKSTGGSAEAIARLCLNDSTNILYVAPEMDQARKYSQDKVKPMIEESPIIKRQIGRYNNVHEKEFVRGGKLYLKYAKDNADRCRGITAGMVHYDEVQDQNLELIEPVINEVLFTSQEEVKLYSGTPKSLSNPIHHKWLQSDQREWVIRCRHHTPVKYVNLTTRNIGKHGPTCHHCGNVLDVDDGIWVAHNPHGDIAGFHVNQLHCKISHATPQKWKSLLNKFENYDDNLFLNEVMGESADSAENPITEEDLRKACYGGVRISEEPLPEFFSSPRFAGIDWGHGIYTTVLTIGQFWGGKYRILFMKAYEGDQCKKEYCIPDMTRIINRYQCERAHVDYGGGFGMWDDLDVGTKCPVTGMMWTNIQNPTWRTNYKDANGDEFEYSIPMLSMNKKMAMSAFLKDLLKGNIQLPDAIDFFGPKYGNNPTLRDNKENARRTFANQFLALQKETSVDQKGNTVIQYLRSGPDDALQSAIYSWVIAKMHMFNLR